MRYAKPVSRLTSGPYRIAVTFTVQTAYGRDTASDVLPTVYASKKEVMKAIHSLDMTPYLSATPVAA